MSTEPGLFEQLAEAAPDAIVVADAAGRIVLLNGQTEAQFESHLRNAMESIPGAFAIFDAHDRLALCNGSYRQLLGEKLTGEVAGRTFEDLAQAGIDAGCFSLERVSPEEFLARRLRYHRDPVGVMDVSTAHGRNLRIAERRTAEGGTVEIIRDVTDSVKREEELRRARLLAEAANSAKSEFFASISHELRTPLNAVLGFAQLLRRDRREPLSLLQMARVGQVIKAGEHLLALIDDVLDLSRIEAGSLSLSAEPVRVAEMLEEICRSLEPTATDAGNELEVSPVGADIPEVMADRTRLKQILMNHGSNAIKYGRPGLRVTFRTTANHGCVRITVVYHGTEALGDAHANLQPFQRATQAAAGAIERTRVGLAISKRLAELMGGAAGFQNRHAQGSELWVELPMAAGTGSRPAAKPLGAVQNSALAGSDAPRHLVVYIEDNPSNVFLLQEVLADFDGVALVTAPSAEIGLEIVRARQPNLVIMDINLPGMSGFEATRRLHEWPETRHIPVVALSAAEMMGDPERIRQAGFYRYLTKPMHIGALVLVLEELLTRPSVGSSPPE